MRVVCWFEEREREGRKEGRGRGERERCCFFDWVMNFVVWEKKKMMVLIML